nr:MAG TPA: hypothetical protein [Caudoviricetes sp.]
MKSSTRILRRPQRMANSLMTASPEALTARGGSFRK